MIVLVVNLIQAVMTIIYIAGSFKLKKLLNHIKYLLYLQMVILLSRICNFGHTEE
jgi:hypothetical protein